MKFRTLTLLYLLLCLTLLAPFVIAQGDSDGGGDVDGGGDSGDGGGGDDGNNGDEGGSSDNGDGDDSTDDNDGSDSTDGNDGNDNTDSTDDNDGSDSTDGNDSGGNDDNGDSGDSGDSGDNDDGKNDGDSGDDNDSGDSNSNNGGNDEEDPEYQLTFTRPTEGQQIYVGKSYDIKWKSNYEGDDTLTLSLLRAKEKEDISSSEVVQSDFATVEIEEQSYTWSVSSGSETLTNGTTYLIRGFRPGVVSAYSAQFEIINTGKSSDGKGGNGNSNDGSSGGSQSGDDTSIQGDTSAFDGGSINTPHLTAFIIMVFVAFIVMG